MAAYNRPRYDEYDSPLTEYDEDYDDNFHYEYSYFIESPERIVLKRMMFILAFVVLFVGTAFLYGLPAILQVPTSTVNASTSMTGNLLPAAATETEAETAVVPEVEVQTQRISPVFSREVQHWNDQIIAWAAQHDLDPDKVATVMQIESCGDPNAVSIAGAQGCSRSCPSTSPPVKICKTPTPTPSAA
jgi:hypothetical protein